MSLGTGLDKRLPKEMIEVQNMNATQSKTDIRCVSEANFDSEVSQSGQPVLALFWAPWSRPCQVIEAVLAGVEADCAGSVKILKVNADDHPYLSLRYDVQFIPTLLCFAAGQLRERLVGTTSKETILSLLHLHSGTSSGQVSADKD